MNVFNDPIDEEIGPKPYMIFDEINALSLLDVIWVKENHERLLAKT